MKYFNIFFYFNNFILKLTRTCKIFLIYYRRISLHFRNLRSSRIFCQTALKVSTTFQTIPFSIKISRIFYNFLVMEDRLCYYNDVSDLCDAIVTAYSIEEWRPSIDCSSKTLKVVLLYISNKYPSLLILHSVHLNLDYRRVKILLETLNYKKNDWKLLEISRW